MKKVLIIFISWSLSLFLYSIDIDFQYSLEDIKDLLNSDNIHYTYKPSEVIKLNNLGVEEEIITSQKIESEIEFLDTTVMLTCAFSEKGEMIQYNYSFFQKARTRERILNALIYKYGEYIIIDDYFDDYFACEWTITDVKITYKHYLEKDFTSLTYRYIGSAEEDSKQL